MGSDKRQDPQATEYEMPQGTVVLNRFYIGRYEVTVGQMRAFALAGGTVDPDTLTGASALPAADVNWRVARAYSNWLDEQVRQSSSVPRAFHSVLSAGEGCRVTLPSEAEWEKAARGNDGRMYPWGATMEPSRSNHQGADTTVVGSFPAGASPYGVLDMTGNVWEWTRSLWLPYPYVPYVPEREDLNADGLRVVRGGSSNTVEARNRAANREFNDPAFQGWDVGFRLAVSCS